MTNLIERSRSRDFLIPVLLILFNLSLFITVFYFFHDRENYRITLGKISNNYDRTPDDQQIIDVKKPFVQITSANLENWDAAIYKCIKEKGYTVEIGCYDKVRAAFFPLFPFTWRVLNLDTLQICILNYFLFGISLLIISRLLFEGNSQQKNLLFLMALSLPSTIIFLIPYTEAFFMFTFCIAVYGIMKNKYWLYFIGIVLLSMTRPATVFFLLAIIAVDFATWVHRKNSLQSMKEILKKIIPFITGYLLVLLIQHRDSSSWTAMSDAREYWAGGLQMPSTISDWSEEGFGLSLFSVIVICIPALIYSIARFVRVPDVQTSAGNIFTDTLESKKLYLFHVCTTYLGGMLVYMLLFSGGNLHSFFRFTLASPMFYSLFFLFYSRIQKKIILNKSVVFFLPIIILLIVQYNSGYGQPGLNFRLMGFYLLILYYAFYLFQQNLSTRLCISIFTLLIILSTVWNTYLLNMFMCNAWVFT